MNDGDPYFQNCTHGMITGVFVGTLWKHGIQALPKLDPERNYTDIVTVELEDGMFTNVRVLPEWGLPDDED